MITFQQIGNTNSTLWTFPHTWGWLGLSYTEKTESFLDKSKVHEMRVEMTVSGQKFKVEYKHFEMCKWAMNFPSGIPKSRKVIKLQTCLLQFDLDGLVPFLDYKRISETIL